MRIADVPEFSKKHDILAFPSTALVSDIAQKMAERNVGAVPIIDNGRLVGIFSERDMVKRVVAAGLDATKTPVHDVMTPDPQTASPDDWVSDAVEFMIQGHYRHLPIVGHEGELVGFLSQRDFMAVNLGELLKNTAKVSFITLAKAPQVWIMVGGLVLYTIFLLAIS